MRGKNPQVNVKKVASGAGGMASSSYCFDVIPISRGIWRGEFRNSPGGTDVHARSFGAEVPQDDACMGWAVLGMFSIKKKRPDELGPFE